MAPTPDHLRQTIRTALHEIEDALDELVGLYENRLDDAQQERDNARSDVAALEVALEDERVGSSA